MGFLVPGSFTFVLTRLVPGYHELSFADRWRKAVKKVQKDTRKGELNYYFGCLGNLETL